VGNDGINWVDILGLDWINLLTGSSENDWTLVGSGTRRILNSESGTLLYTRGGSEGNGLATVIYNGSNGPPTGQAAGCIEIDFEYRIIGGKNSGFHFSIPEGSDQNGVIRNGLEVQLGTRGSDIINSDYVSNYDQRGNLSNSAIRRRNGLSSERTGSVYQYDEPDIAPDLNEGDWNRITVMLNELNNGQGMEIRISINGQQVNYVNQGDPSHSPIDIGDRSNNPNVPQPGPRQNGQFGFQGHGPNDVTVFRNIRWRTVDGGQDGGE
jgi:hypothetical protein